MTTNETHPDVAAIRARADAATSGPWSVSAPKLDNGDRAITVRDAQYRTPLILAETFSHVAQTVHLPSVANARFIAAARTDIPALLAHIDALEKRATVADHYLSVEVIAFAKRMQAKMDKHPERGDSWKNENFGYLFGRLRKEMTELDMAEMSDLPDECADVANFAMMIAYKATLSALAEAEEESDGE